MTRGIIVQNNCILAAQRPASMSLPFKWELPGGKCEPIEECTDCLIRETMEEVGLKVEITQSLPHVDREFRNKQYRMLPYLCEIKEGIPFAHEHEQVIWWPLDRLWELDWGPAEKMLLEKWLETSPIKQVSSQARVPA